MFKTNETTNFKRRVSFSAVLFITTVLFLLMTGTASAQTKTIYTDLSASPYHVEQTVTFSVPKKGKVRWTTSDKSVAVINSQTQITTVTMKKPGTAFITGKVGDRAWKYKIAVKVKINYSKKTLDVGQTQLLKVYGASKKPVWTSSNKSVAYVASNGRVSAKKAGTATVTGKVGTKKYICKVTVKKATGNTYYTLRITNTVKGSGADKNKKFKYFLAHVDDWRMSSDPQNLSRGIKSNCRLMRCYGCKKGFINAKSAIATDSDYNINAVCNHGSSDNSESSYSFALKSGQEAVFHLQRGARYRIYQIYDSSIDGAAKYTPTIKANNGPVKAASYIDVNSDGLPRIFPQYGVIQDQFVEFCNTFTGSGR